MPNKEELITKYNTFDSRYSIIIYNKDWKKEKEVLLPSQELLIFPPLGTQFITQSKTQNPKNMVLNFYRWTE